MDSSIILDDEGSSLVDTISLRVLNEIKAIKSEKKSAGKKLARTSSRRSTQRSTRSQNEDPDADNESGKTKDKPERRERRGPRRHLRRWRRDVSLNSSNSDSESATSLRSDIEDIGTLSKSYSTALKKLEKLTDHLNGRIEQVEKLENRIRRLERGEEKPESLSANSGPSKTKSGMANSSNDNVMTKEAQGLKKGRDFELKIEFFTEPYSAYHNTSIYPFIRVLCGRLPSHDMDTQQQQESDAVTGRNIVELCIESPVIEQYFGRLMKEDFYRPEFEESRLHLRNAPSYSPSATHRGEGFPHMLYFKTPFRWLIQHRDLFEKHISESRRLVLVIVRRYIDG